jgi:hypothetical protein
LLPSAPPSVLSINDKHTLTCQIFQQALPYPKILAIEKPTIRPEFDILNELKNICVKIPLLQAIKDIPIYNKVIKELFIKKPGRKQKDPPTVHFIGELSEYISEKPRVTKYENPGNLVVTITINKVPIGNNLMDLGATINVMGVTTLEELQLKPLLRPTPTILELEDKTKVIPEIFLDDIIVTLASWEYPIDFLIIHSKDPAKGHPAILGRLCWITERGGESVIEKSNHF